MSLIATEVLGKLILRLDESGFDVLVEYGEVLFKLYLGLQASNLLKNSVASQDLSKLVDTPLLRNLSKLCGEKNPQTFISQHSGEFLLRLFSEKNSTYLN